ncbi:metallophosphoesterase [Halalkalicoccus jeotgali]|uniref:Phosphoesterase n=1 Tax=Halalkalicoccus jeotgali (strain DSM 18796 / CECT 7217 / JCM 14584 / KCTC 4019 / B3) TaxID=795797 RepID=D8J517_HALJB|nr:metallophosphoesterase [Halalkalicoccus jeotgali]ADJ13598.1 phosphodiesterase, MJ0936 family protein [Halalkalicoccus jeotgali B3]ELY33380.1 phosphodiesterase [Halalkalicoccus jeotgali B3]
MLAVVSDTHSTEAHALTGRTLAAVRDAERVIHAGDFTSVSALDAFHAEAPRLDAVHGNADESAVRDRLPAARTLEWEGLRIALTHRRDGGPTGLAMFGRERGADLVVSGHTHAPGVTRTDDLVLLNPGSHADPRGNRPAHAELEAIDNEVRGRLRRPDGTVLEEFSIRA